MRFACTIISSHRGISNRTNILRWIPALCSGPVKGIATQEPVYGLPALWIHESDKESC